MDDAMRALPLEGASNFRDLGGYAAGNGMRVRWRRLFRSDQLSALTQADAQALARLGLARTIDFRGQEERSAQPYALPRVRQLPLPIEPTVVRRYRELAARGERFGVALADRLMRETYLGFVADDAPQFAQFFEQLLQDDAPLVFHCTAGKDRTGFAAALLLLALGVGREQVMQDYLLTNRLYRRPPPPAQDDTTRAVHEVIWGVRAEYLQSALAAVDQGSGGLQGYLQGRLGLSDAARARLAALYLEAPPR
ncbi:MAG: protein tyrosine phosphatase [Burkholderiales bacterium 66-5]|uniref:tyrosine-protein phosphatase n=1 Tax=Comamonas badia TaxID=265291 RepID=UPI000466E8BE|nr:tyrosine-protein phosphatase [Comamonas badia]OJU89586.1 MAG: protein tyrosine phosphatase [Burkholderiales bacterium 66-5]